MDTYIDPNKHKTTKMMDQNRPKWTQLDTQMNKNGDTKWSLIKPNGHTN